MLNRRLLRIKIFQALYSYYQSENADVSTSLKNLFTSLDKMHELFIRNLLIILKIADILDDRFETQKQKFYKNEEISEQTRRFSDVSCIQLLRNNNHFQRFVSEYKINLSEDSDMLRQLARNIESNLVYKSFCSSETEKSDMEILRSIYKSEIYTNPLMLSRLEEMNIHWSTDQYFIGIILMTYLKKDSFFNQANIPLPETFKTADFDEAESDEDFVKFLFVKTINHADEYQEMINMYLENWEPDRIALCDLIIMKMALAEIIHFQQIPVKVSLNEYIELTKTFSTPKSKIFVNGLLDKVISHYNKEGKIEKIGRGLQDN
jgi:transcription antitermination protein NusB